MMIKTIIIAKIITKICNNNMLIIIINVQSEQDNNKNMDINSFITNI